MLLEAGGHRLLLLEPEAGNRDIVYTHMDEGQTRAVYDLLPSPRPALVSVTDIDWNRELSPWPAQKVFRGGEDFGGEAEEYLSGLIGEIIPAAEQALGMMPQRRGLAGYSLAGLFAIWAAYNTDAFDAVASMSGSLWYEGMMEYMRTGKLSANVKSAYLSLGDREEKTRNARMARVRICTEEACGLLSAAGVQTQFEMNPGGHFDDVSARITKGIAGIWGS